MRIIFFGSSKYSTIAQKVLFENFDLSLVVTLPDKILGRKKILTPNPVKQFAIENNIPVLTLEKLNNETMKQLNNVCPTDFLIVCDYGLLLPKELLEIPKYAPLNIHHSLLPKYRGPSPAQTAILNGDKISGVTIIKMNEKQDAGDILSQKEYILKPDETTDSLLTALNNLGAQIIIPVIKNYTIIKGLKQDEEKASFTKKLNKNDGYIDINPPAGGLPSKVELDRMIRAYYPWPSVWSKFEIRNSKFEILKFLPGKKLQVAGKKPMTYKDFANGYPETKEIIDKLT